MYPSMFYLAQVYFLVLDNQSAFSFLFLIIKNISRIYNSQQLTLIKKERLIKLAKVIALKTNNHILTDLLAEKGYKVIDIYEAAQPGIHTDIFLYTGFHPETLYPFHNMVFDDCTISINITGMPPKQVLLAIERQLAFNQQNL